MKQFFKMSQKIVAFSSLTDSTFGSYQELIKNYIKLGADIIYIKIQCTKDNTLLVYDNDTVQSNEKKIIKISMINYNELLSLNQENFQRSIENNKLEFYTLEAILQEFPEQRFIIEFNAKRITSINKFCEVIQVCNARDRVLIYSFFTKTLKMIRKNIPEIAQAVSLFGVLGVYALFKAGLLYFKRKFESDVIMIPESVGMSYIGNSGLIRECRLKGLRVYVYTENKRHQVVRLNDIGINGYITKDVAVLRQILEELDEIIQE